MVPVGVIRPILLGLASASVNQRLPSGPNVMSFGWLVPDWLLAGATGNSVTLPAGVMRPILFPPHSVNQRLPSGPAVMPHGKLDAVGTGSSVMTPAGVILPMLFP